MDVVKVFTEEPIGLETLVPDSEPDARRRGVASGSLEAFLQRGPEPYGRVYVAGTALGPPHRIGATALDDPTAWTAPLLAWAEGRAWTAWDGDSARLGTEADRVAASRTPVSPRRRLALVLVYTP